MSNSLGIDLVIVDMCPSISSNILTQRDKFDWSRSCFLCMYSRPSSGVSSMYRPGIPVSTATKDASPSASMKNSQATFTRPDK